jgi:hypothetical protein
MSRYELFDRRRVQLRPLAERGHDLVVADCLPLAPPQPRFVHPDWCGLVERIVAARRRQRPVILMMGAHAIKLGLSRFLIDLIERKWITHLATNGAGLVHDFELASFGGTSENVARWIQVGQFGLWQETSRLNEIARHAAAAGEGLGEAAGRILTEQPAPHAAVSLAAAAWRAGVPMTIHVGIGCDIIHAHPNCDGAAWGAASDTDFLIFARSIQDLPGGVFINFGTAVTGPEVFLKALSMTRNVARQDVQTTAGSGDPSEALSMTRNLARQEGALSGGFTTAVFDLIDLPQNWREGTPSKQESRYYYRPWKTILARTVAGGGQSYYFCGDHRQTLPTLWAELAEK